MKNKKENFVLEPDEIEFCYNTALSTLAIYNCNNDALKNKSNTKCFDDREFIKTNSKIFKRCWMCWHKTLLNYAKENIQR